MSLLEQQLFAEIAKMQGSLSGNPTAPQYSGLTDVDVRRIAKEVITEELNALKDSLPQAAPPQTPAVETQPEPTIQDAVNLALNEDERNWLIQNNNFSTIEQKLPRFLMTEDGQVAIQSLLIYLRSGYES